MNIELRNPSELSRVYKVTFNNGDTHYGRVVSSKNYSAKTYLVEQSRKLKYNSNNPLRVNMTTEVEKRICNEFETTICEIVFEGPTSEAIKFKYGEQESRDISKLNRLSGQSAQASANAAAAKQSQNAAIGSMVSSVGSIAAGAIGGGM